MVISVRFALKYVDCGTILVIQSESESENTYEISK